LKGSETHFKETLAYIFPKQTARLEKICIDSDGLL